MDYPEMVIKKAERRRIYLERKDRRRVLEQRCNTAGFGTREEFRKRVLEKYGNRCACCSEKNKGFLTIDQIGGGGIAHRKQSGDLYYQDILTSLNPEKYRLLCMNCNWATRGGRICPHEV